MCVYSDLRAINKNNNQSAEGAGGLGITKDNKLGESE